LADNGGATRTHLPALDSPLINRGANPALLLGDQRGLFFPRSLAGQSDIGSVEVLDLVVRNDNDAGPGSLRQAIGDANAVFGTNSITFDPTFFTGDKTITLTTGTLIVSDPVVIDGPDSTKLTISGNNSFAVFWISTGGSLVQDSRLSDLTITGG